MGDEHGKQIDGYKKPLMTEPVFHQSPGAHHGKDHGDQPGSCGNKDAIHQTHMEIAHDPEPLVPSKGKIGGERPDRIFRKREIDNVKDRKIEKHIQENEHDPLPDQSSARFHSHFMPPCIPSF